MVTMAIATGPRQRFFWPQPPGNEPARAATPGPFCPA